MDFDCNWQVEMNRNYCLLKVLHYESRCIFSTYLLCKGRLISSSIAESETGKGFGIVNGIGMCSFLCLQTIFDQTAIVFCTNMDLPMVTSQVSHLLR